MEFKFGPTVYDLQCEQGSQGTIRPQEDDMFAMKLNVHRDHEVWGKRRLFEPNQISSVIHKTVRMVPHH
jgi:hypothetical protein